MMMVTKGHLLNTANSTNNSAIKQQNSGVILENLTHITGALNLASRKFEKFLAKKGDSVTADIFGRPIVKNYLRNQELEYDLTSSQTVKLFLNQERYVAERVDVIDEQQSDNDILSIYSDAISSVMLEDMNRYVVAEMLIGASPSNIITRAVDESNINKVFTELKTMFVTNLGLKGSVRPRVAVPPEVFALIESYIQNNTQFITTQDGKADLNVSYTNDMINYYGVDLYQDTTIVQDPTTGLYQCPATVEGGYQLVVTHDGGKVERLKLEKHFAGAVRALAVYGGAVFRPELVGRLNLSIS
jgi:hypothetical protein